MIVSSQEMREAEERAFATGIKPETLMDVAGEGIARMVGQFHPHPGTCICFYGKGNNGGDALVAASLLARRGWKIEERPAFADGALTPLTAEKQRALRTLQPLNRTSFGPLVVLDGLLGTGARSQPAGAVAQAINEINSLRAGRGAWVLAIDIPSGLDTTTGCPLTPCVEADATATLGFPKKALLADEATRWVGRLALIPLPAIHVETGDEWQLTTPALLRESPCSFERHKGQAGRVAIVAGSVGFIGAARLCSAAAARAGAGLVTLFTPPEIADQLAVACIPEVMVAPLNDFREVLDFPCNALAVGPGLGRSRDSQVVAVVRDSAVPTVVDADALNALAQDMGVLTKAQAPRLLTPHPGEMQRLYPQGERDRRAWATDFVARYPVTLLLKGARTIVTQHDKPGYYNSTGHPGMATGGMGDVLTGVCVALLARGCHSPAEAATTAAWLCGRSAEIAVLKDKASQESLLASDVVTNLGEAFCDLRSAVF